MDRRALVGADNSELQTEGCSRHHQMDDDDGGQSEDQRHW